MFTVMSIDPGTNNMGVTIQTIDPYTKTKVVLHSCSVNLKTMAYAVYGHLIDIQGEKQVKLLCVTDSIIKFIQTFQPCVVISESPYMSKFPAAYGALMECLSHVRMGISYMNPCMPLEKIDPAKIKNSVGVPGNSGDKKLMRQAVGRLIASHGISINIDDLDEHAIDSIAVGHAWYRLNVLQDM